MIDLAGNSFEKLTFRDYTIVTTCSTDLATQLVSAVVDQRLDFQKKYRDNKRTLSALFCFGDHNLILKIPRARNSRIWERFLTLFRPSESRRIFNSQLKLRELSLIGPTPILAAERRTMGCVVESFVVYQYLEGVPGRDKDAQSIFNTLIGLHEQGYLRGDPQLVNFIMDRGDVQFIDFKLKKPVFLPKIQTYMELSDFLGKCPTAQPYLPEEIGKTIKFKIASWLFGLKGGIRRLRRRIKSLLN